MEDRKLEAALAQVNNEFAQARKMRDSLRRFEERKIVELRAKHANGVELDAMELGFMARMGVSA